ncbi:MAG: ABC transporter permease, partial [Bacteroidetes bacterium]|nr:ABC transporter permease [Bacteroidota bacterium]
DRIYIAEQGFLDMFSFPILQGNTASALKEPYQLVFTEPTARKYFGEENPIGQTVLFGIDEKPYTVTGVVAQPPSNSQFSFDILMSFATIEHENPDISTGRWFWFDYYTYIALDPQADYKALEAKLPEFVQKVASEAEEAINQKYHFLLEPLTEIYLKSKQDYQISSTGNELNLYIFIAIAILTLIIASINFVNLATARAFRRAREVGIRKVVGAHYRQLIGQFLTESFVITFIAFSLAIVITWFVLPGFNELSGKTLAITQYLTPSYAGIFLGLCMLVSFVSGIFPAFVLAKFRPVSVLKTRFQFTQGGAILRKVLVIFQLTISILLLTGTWVIHEQWQHLKEFDLGYEKEQLLVINYRYDSRVLEKSKVLKEAFLSNPAVEKVSISMNSPASDPGNWYASYEADNGEMKNGSLNGYLVDFDFLDTYEMEVIAGRAFSPDFTLDSTEAFMVNEAAVKYFNWGTPEEAVGKKFQQYGKEGKIIGVIKDFHYQSLHNTIEPLAIQLTFNRATRFTLRLNTDDHLAVLQDLQETWASLVPFREMDYQFVDQTLEQKYETEAKTEAVFRSFAILTLIVACLGILGLAAFMASQQRKEVSIRKVLGAQVPALVFRYSKDFILLAIMAFVIAMPIAWWGIAVRLRG